MEPTVGIEQASKKRRKLRLALIGVTKSGKTFSALKFARALAGEEGTFGVIDTEGGNSEFYQGGPHVGGYLIVRPKDFSPAVYIKWMRALVEKGVSCIVLDSLSHAWSGPGGCLEIVDKSSGGASAKSPFGGWAKATPLHNDLISAINNCPVHLIATMRQKGEYVIETNERGKQIPRRIGMAAVQREGMEYEFDITATMNDAVMTIDGIRGEELADFMGASIPKPGAEFIADIRKYLDTAHYVKPIPTAPAPEPKEPPTAPANWTYTDDLFNRAKGLIKAAQTHKEVQTLRDLVGQRKREGLLQHDHPSILIDLCEDMDKLIKADTAAAAVMMNPEQTPNPI